MSNAFQRLTAPLLLVCFCSLASCSGAISRDECISKYAQRGGTDQIVRWGYQLCAMATDVKSSAKDRAEALCAVRKIPSTPSELAFRQVIGECREN